MTQSRAWDAELARSRIEELQHLPGALLPMLHALQEEFGYVGKEAVPLLADALNLSHAEVHGVVSFYHDFRHAPPGRHVLRLCRAEACQSMGAEALIAYVRDRLNVELGGTTADNSFTVEAVYCLGNCACSPAAMLDGKLHGRLSPERVETLISDARRRP